MNYEQYTIKAQEALRSATILAQQEDHSEVGTAHILSAILEQADGIIPPLFERIGVPIKRIQAEAKELVSQTPKMHGNVQISISPEAAKVLAKAEKEAAQLKDEYLSVEHILLALTNADDRTADLLRQNGVNREDILAALKEVRGSDHVTSQDPDATMKSLEKYCRNLTALAKQEKIDPVI